ncbi:hypothetical protein RDV78_00850 [Bacillota bacterium LX-D]|nr:hypothetical protein [Bacillota bacterium LX-D]
MKIKDLRLHLIIFYTCLFLILLLAGHEVYERYYVQHSLVDKINSIAGVQKVVVIKSKENLTLNITLGTVDDLNSTYQQIKNSIVLPKKIKTEIKLKDKRNNRLSNIWNESKFIIYEALEKGNFTKMKSDLKIMMGSSGLDKWEVSIDNNNIYVGMYDGSNYLYEIIPRK